LSHIFGSESSTKNVDVVSEAAEGIRGVHVNQDVIGLEVPVHDVTFVEVVRIDVLKRELLRVVEERRAESDDVRAAFGALEVGHRQILERFSITPNFARRVAEHLREITNFREAIDLRHVLGP
jgi:hypothetical protein